jgi:hypothetical protein
MFWALLAPRLLRTRYIFAPKVSQKLRALLAPRLGGRKITPSIVASNRFFVDAVGDQMITDRISILWAAIPVIFGFMACWQLCIIMTRRRRIDVYLPSLISESFPLGRWGFMDLLPERCFFHGPHLHRNAPAGLDDLVPYRREDDFAIGSDEIVVAFLDVGANDVDGDEGVFNERFHDL